MSTEALIHTFKSLKLYGMAQSIDELANQSAPAYQQAEPLINVLLNIDIPSCSQ